MDKLTTHTDERGCLTIVEALKDFPFTINRAYWLHSVPEGAERGFHASRSCYEYLVSMCGSIEIALEDAEGRQTYILNKKDEGLIVPPYTWIELKNFSPDAVLLVLASDEYQPESYINDYEEFQEEMRREMSGNAPSEP
jgi:dTDP-4-dehydrorhamnose 3,5-epimerase-like enzyme